jgi:DNA repair ATPase RecN
LKPRKIEFKPKIKKKGKSKSGRMQVRKNAVRKATMREYVKEVIELKQKEENNSTKNEEKNKKSFSVLDRFKKKK